MDRVDIAKLAATAERLQAVIDDDLRDLVNSRLRQPAHNVPTCCPMRPGNPVCQWTGATTRFQRSGCLPRCR